MNSNKTFNINRLVIDDLIEWKVRRNRKPLIIRGARQVGKTYLVERFAKDNFKTVLKLDFEEEPSYRRLFNGSLNPEKVIAEIELLFSRRITDGETLIFFDEVQRAPQAIAALRYFYEKRPNLHVIAAGSLLEFALETISFPVGRVESLEVHPVSFDEFLQATGRDLLINHRPSLSKGLKELIVSDAAHSKLTEALREYIAVGGMPEVVRHYVESKSLLEVRAIQTELIRNFRDDVPKYTKGNLQAENIWKVWQRVPRFIGHEIKYSTLGEGDPAARTSKSIELLSQAQLCKIIQCTSAAQLPFAANSNSKHFKLIHLDVGLLGAVSGLNLQSFINPSSSDERDLIAVFEGRLAEQLVGQMLCAESKEASEEACLYYWSRTAKGGAAELDYLISRRGEIIPIEVKNGPEGKLRSLKVFLESNPQIKTSIVLRDINRVRRLPSSRCIEAPLYTKLD